MTACPNPATCPFTDDNEPHSINDHPGMKDRRPEKLYKRSGFRQGAVNYEHEEATIDEVLAVVRRGVESGTIKGEVKRDDLRALRVLLRAYGHEEGLSRAIDAWLKDRLLVVIGPVSDGGSEI